MQFHYNLPLLSLILTLKFTNTFPQLANSSWALELLDELLASDYADYLSAPNAKKGSFFIFIFF